MIQVYRNHIHIRARRPEHLRQPRHGPVKTRPQIKVVGVIFLDGFRDGAEVALHHQGQEVRFILVRDVFGGGLLAVALAQPGEGCLLARLTLGELQIVLQRRAAQRHLIV